MPVPPTPCQPQQPGASGQLSVCMVEELAVARVFLPIAYTDLRAKLGGRALAMDASEAGGGGGPASPRESRAPAAGVRLSRRS